MKKLLVVLMVLAMASVANAAVEFTDVPVSVDVGASVSLGIAAPEEMPLGAYFFVVLDGGTGAAEFDISSANIVYPGEGSGLTMFNPADDPDSAAFWQSLNTNYFMAELVDNVTPISPLIGSAVTGIMLTGVTAGDITLRAWDASGESWVDYAVTVTPEPITMVLLGLGGLMLRRRK